MRRELIDYADKIYLEFGADPPHEASTPVRNIEEIRKNAIHAGLKLVDCPSAIWAPRRHRSCIWPSRTIWQTTAWRCASLPSANIILEEEGCKGVLLKVVTLLPVYADEVVIGTGRRGADWLERSSAQSTTSPIKPGTVDIGVRVECRNEVMEKVNKGAV